MDICSCLCNVLLWSVQSNLISAALVRLLHERKPVLCYLQWVKPLGLPDSTGVVCLNHKLYVGYKVDVKFLLQNIGTPVEPQSKSNIPQPTDIVTFKNNIISKGML